MAALPTALRTPAPVARWLAGKSRAERSVVATVAIAVAVAVLWIGLWQPLRRDAESLRAARDANAVALAAARRMTEEAAGLAHATPTRAPADAHAALERILAQQTLRGAVTQLDWQDDRARLVFAAIPYDALVALLEALQRDGKLRAVDATLTARVESGTVRAELTLAR